MFHCRMIVSSTPFPRLANRSFAAVTVVSVRLEPVLEFWTVWAFFFPRAKPTFHVRQEHEYVIQEAPSKRMDVGFYFLPFLERCVTRGFFFYTICIYYSPNSLIGDGLVGSGWTAEKHLNQGSQTQFTWGRLEAESGWDWVASGIPQEKLCLKKVQSSQMSIF